RSRAQQGGGLGVEGQPRKGGEGAALRAQDQLDALLGCALGEAPTQRVQRGATVALGKLAALGGLVDIRQPAPGQETLEQGRGALWVAQQEPLDLGVLEESDLLTQGVQADGVAVMRGDEAG